MGEDAFRVDGVIAEALANGTYLVEHCKIVKRRGVIRVICTNRRHKQRQG